MGDPCACTTSNITSQTAMLRVGAAKPIRFARNRQPERFGIRKYLTHPHIPEGLGAELHFRQLSCDVPVRFYIRAHIESFLLIGPLNGTSTNSLTNSGPGSTVNVHCLS